MTWLDKLARAMFPHQTVIVWGAFGSAWFTGLVFSFLDWRLPKWSKIQISGIFTLEFLLLAAVLIVIDRLIKLSKEAQVGEVGDIEGFAKNYGGIFVLFLLEYVIIIVSCGFKYWSIFSGGAITGQPTFRITIDGYTPTIWDWLLYSAENVVPLEHSGILPLSIAARAFSMGQLLGNLIVTILLIDFTVSLLRFERR